MPFRTINFRVENRNFQDKKAEKGYTSEQLVKIASVTTWSSSHHSLNRQVALALFLAPRLLDEPVTLAQYHPNTTSQMN
jgi:hypothetical protein